MRDPADVAGRERSQPPRRVLARGGARGFLLAAIEHGAHVADRSLRPRPAARVDRRQETVDLPARPAFQRLERRFAGAREGKPEAPGVFRARMGFNPAAVAEPPHDPAQMRLVHAQRPTDPGGRLSRRRRMADLVEDSRFRQRNVAAGQPPVEQTDLSCVEPVETAKLVGESHAGAASVVAVNTTARRGRAASSRARPAHKCARSLARVASPTRMSLCRGPSSERILPKQDDVALGHARQRVRRRDSSLAFRSRHARPRRLRREARAGLNGWRSMFTGGGSLRCSAAFRRFRRSRPTWPFRASVWSRRISARVRLEAASSIAVFLVGFSTAPLAVGPLADRFGRKPVLLAGLALFTLAAIGCALAPSIVVLIVSRIVQGAGAGTVAVLPRAIIRDVFEGRQARLQLAAVSVVFSAAPLIGPTLGAGLLAIGPWRLIYAALAALGVDARRPRARDAGRIPRHGHAPQLDAGDDRRRLPACADQSDVRRLFAGQRAGFRRPVRLRQRFAASVHRRLRRDGGGLRRAVRHDRLGRRRRLADQQLAAAAPCNAARRARRGADAGYRGRAHRPGGEPSAGVRR